MAAVHLQVEGMVQGVGFRWFVREEARRLGLSGWVRNRDDGSVELVASGPSDALSAIRDAVRRGPPGAVVSQVRELPGEGPDPLPAPFTILR